MRAEGNQAKEILHSVQLESYPVSADIQRRNHLLYGFKPARHFEVSGATKQGVGQWTEH